jgi:hypothetical protein
MKGTKLMEIDYDDKNIDILDFEMPAVQVTLLITNDTVHAKGAGINGLYGLDLKFSRAEINKKLERAPKFKQTPIDPTEYPRELAHVNPLRFLLELLH